MFDASQPCDTPSSAPSGHLPPWVGKAKIARLEPSPWQGEGGTA